MFLFGSGTKWKSKTRKKLEAVKLRMEKLAEELEKHNKAYYIDKCSDGV